MTKIDDILNDFQKKFGIFPKKPRDLKVISTGHEELDKALGINGIPKGKTIEISGEAGSGKTLLAYDIIANAQKQDLIVLYIDAERNLSQIYAKHAGINLNKLLVCTPTCGEMAIQIIVYHVEHDLVDLIVIDSMSALPSINELENDFGDYKVQEQMIGTMLKDVMTMIDDTDVTLLCLNQIRWNLKTKQQTVSFDKYVRYYASVRIRLTKLKSITKWRKIRGYTIEADIHKNNYHHIMATEYNLMLKGTNNA